MRQQKHFLIFGLLISMALTSVTMGYIQRKTVSLENQSLEVSENTPAEQPTTEIGKPFAIATARETAALNPLLPAKDGAADVQGWVLESLIAFDESTGKWVPRLAESWHISQNGREITFKLRTEATWWDQRPVQIDDVKFSFDRLFDSQYPLTPLRIELDCFQKVEIVAPQKIRFIAKHRHFLNLSLISRLPVLPRHIYENVEKAKHQRDLLVGSGPYIFTQRLPGQSFHLKKDPHWWGRNLKEFKGRFNFPEISYRIIGDDTIALEMLRKGELDFLPMTLDVFLKSKPLLGGHNQNFKIEPHRDRIPGSVTALAWNLELPLFQQKEVRLALALLFDRKMMQEKFYAGYGSLARGPWSWTSDYADSSLRPIPYDPERAIQILKEAGWKDSDGDLVLDKNLNGKKTDLRFSVLTGDPNLERALTIFQHDAKAVGIDIGIRFMGWNPIAKLVKERKFEALDTFVHGGSIDIDPRGRWHSQSATPDGVNFSYFKNEQVDKLIEAAETSFSIEKRRILLQKAYRIIAEEMPYLFIFNEFDRFYAHSARVRFKKPYLAYGLGLDTWHVEETGL